MDRLRSPGGCPWDAEQDHRSLVTYLVEEAYELIEAIESDDRDAMLEELGDVLLQVIFHARIAEEHADQPFGIEDVARAISTKLVSRHQHVFGDERADTAADVEQNWERLKAEEKGRTSAMDGVPMAQPALALAQKLLHRAQRHQIAVADPGLVELPEQVNQESIGALLWTVAQVADAHGIDAEAALRVACREFAAEVRNREQDDTGR
jgi:XTP/dITP diphosphohydrolase